MSGFNIDFNGIAAGIGDQLARYTGQSTAAAPSPFDRYQQGGEGGSAFDRYLRGGPAGSPLDRYLQIGGGGSSLDRYMQSNVFETALDRGVRGEFKSISTEQELALEKKKNQDLQNQFLTPPARQSGSAGFGGPASAADNAGITGEQVNQWIAATRGNSPLTGLGDFILKEANARDVSVPFFLGMMLKETQLGADGSSLARQNNFGGLIDLSRDEGLGGQRAFQMFPTREAGITALLDTLASPIYRGKSAPEQIGAWYVGPKEFERLGLDATDMAGNGTVRQYLENFIYPTYQAFGKQPTRASAVTVDPAGTLFPIEGYRGSLALHHNAHPGAADLFAPAGTPVRAMRGGTVTWAGYSDVGGNAVMVQGNDGLQYYYAHLDRAPLVATGQQIGAGAHLGGVGDSGNARGKGAHLHLGIGRSIGAGAGAAGGAGLDWDGSPFDAVSLLGGILGTAPGGPR